MGWRWGEVPWETTPTIHTLSQSEVPWETTPAASLSSPTRDHSRSNPESKGTRLPTGNDGSRCKADDEGIVPQRKGIYEKDAPYEETVAPDWSRGETTPTSVRAPRQISANHPPPLMHPV